MPQASGHVPRQHPHISRPVELLKHEYDVVVVGSGYGGGVAASRMARGGQSVCLLERGIERWPGQFPETIQEAVPQLHISGNFQPNDKRGHELNIGKSTSLYHLIVGEGQNAFVGNGLGGTSLLNANIFLRTDERTQAMEAWPEELRSRDALDKYYDRASDMLQPEPYPDTNPRLPKLDLLEAQQKVLGKGKFYRPPQTTRFVDGVNSSGVEMQASSLSGMDSTGLNDGSKSTTLVTYLSDAWNWGAEMFCECEVRYVLPSKRGGYNVFFAWHGGQRDKLKDHIYDDIMWVHAKKFVFLGAGSLGTTEILLRSKEYGLTLSDAIGNDMSGNGDILAFGYNLNKPVNSVGRPHPPTERPVGPTITGVIDCRDQADPLDGFVIEEGAVPQALAPFYQLMLETLPGRLPSPGLSISDRWGQYVAATKSRLAGPYSINGSSERTQVYLIMSHDSNQAIMTLKDDKPQLKFLGVGRSEHVKQLNQHLADITHAFNGTCVNSPFFAAFGQQEITVHPIGGAGLSSTGKADDGVISHTGEVLTGSGIDCHTGLAVVDGAAIPTALGVNPFATITALAERSVELLALRSGIEIDYNTRNGHLDFVRPAHDPVSPDEMVTSARDLITQAQAGEKGGIEFSEIMKGYIHIGDEIKDYASATRRARGSDHAAHFLLSVRAFDLEKLIRSNKHEGMLTGTFTHGALDASPYMVLRGTFQLFNEDEKAPDTKNLTYDFDMMGTDGSKLHFHGYKIVNAAIAGSLLATWRATSTLYVDITKPDDGSLVGRGTQNISPHDFVDELETFRPSGVTALTKTLSVTSFLTYFTHQLMRPFLGPFASLQYPAIGIATESSVRTQRPDPTSVERVTAKDGVVSDLFHWTPSSKATTARKAPLFFIPGASVSQEMYALPTIRYNAIQFLTDQGFDCYCVVTRVGMSLAAKDGGTVYDARSDIAAGLEYVISKHAEKVYVIGHCAGSLAFASGLLDGTISTERIAGITASNVFFNPILVTANRLKALSPIPLTSMYSLLARSQWFDCSSGPSDYLVQRMLNQLLRFYPVGGRQELCSSNTCHRSDLIFGRLWSHRNMNEATHSQLEWFLSGISMPALSHLISCGSAQAALANDRKTSLVTSDNVKRLKRIKVLLFSGDENVVFGPESTERSYETLRDELGPDDFERVVFEGRGHLDCWMSDSADVVWKRVLAHVELATA